MVPLRVLAIFSNLLFCAFGALEGAKQIIRSIYSFHEKNEFRLVAAFC